MKICPYCKEEIRDTAVKCRYCGNFLEPMAKRDIGILAYKETKIYWIIFVVGLILYDILMFSYWLSINDKDTAIVTFCFLAWDAFFGYFLLKFKKWAKICISLRIIIRLIAMIKLVFLQPNLYVISEILVLLSFVFLLFIKKGGVLKKIKITFVSVSYILFIFCTPYLILSNIQYKRTIQTLPFLSEYVSEKGYKIKLPSVKWRILKEEQTKKIFSESFIKDWDTVLTADNGKLHGFLLGFPVNKEEIKLDEMKQTMKKEIIPSGVAGIEEEMTDSEITMRSKLSENNDEYFLIYNFRILGRLGLFSYFIGLENDFNKYKGDIKKIISSAEEIPLKAVLKKFPPNDLFKKYKDAVALVRVYDKKGKIIGFGTCFNLMKEGLIVTNLHVIIGANYFNVKFPNGAVYEEGYLVGLSKKIEDLALLKIVGDNIPFINAETASDLAVGDKVFVIGNPEGLVNTLSEGIVSGIREISTDRRYYQITAPISPGSSGSPVFDEFGRLVGIATFYLEGGQNLNFCIPIDELASMKVLENMITLEQFSQILKEK